MFQVGIPKAIPGTATCHRVSPLGPLSQTPHGRRLNQCRFIVSQFRRLEAQDQGVLTVDFF